MSMVLIEAKLRPPVLRSALVSRRRLVERLATAEAPIGVVIAPPGFGKTTLLVQSQGSVQGPFAWLSLDDGDNDPVVFWSSLVAAIARVVPGFGVSVASALSSIGGLAVDSVVARVLNELETCEQPLVLVLDDYHRITSRVCHDSLALFVERQPATLRLVIATRADPPLPVARWRANGRLAELRAADLGFNGSETEQALNGVWGLDLAAPSIALLHERTEGWPAGLYLASLSLHRVPDPAVFLADFGGGTRLIVDYLMEVVLEQQDQERRDFLLDTSVLTEGLCGSLCDAVTGRTDSANVLTELENQNLFIIGLDDRREWFRYHQLFAQALTEELARRGAGRLSELHRRAATWFTARGDVGRAIHHAVAGGDLDTAATMVATNWSSMINVGRLATVRGWVDAFPRPVVAADARLLLVQAWLAGLEGDADTGLRAVSAARRVGYQGENPDGSGTIEESAALLRASFPWSDVGAMLEAARAAYSTEGQRETAWQAVTAMNLGWALILAGRPEEARAPLLQAVRLASRSEQWVSAADSRALLAEVCVASGELGTAQNWIRDAVELATRSGVADLPWFGRYQVLDGMIHARTGHHQEADRLMSEGLQRIRGAWEPLHVADALLELAAVRQTLGRPGEGRAMIEEARAIIDACPDPGMLGERLQHAARALVPAHRRANQDTGLTKRELDVLKVLAAGATERQAAATLFVSPSTIHSHTKSIYLKLGTSSRSEALSRARELGIIG